MTETKTPAPVTVSPDCAFRVLYLNGSSAVNSGVAQPLIKVSNTSKQDVALSSLVIEYWMAGPPSALAVSSVAGTLLPEGTDASANVQVELMPGYASGLMTIVQVSFAAGALLAPGESVDLDISIIPRSGQAWNQTSDPSYKPRTGKYAYNPKMPVYCHGYPFQGSRPSAGSCLSTLRTNPEGVDFLCVLWGVQENLDHLREAQVISSMTAHVVPEAAMKTPVVEQVYLRQPYFYHMNLADSTGDIFIHNAQNLISTGSTGYHCVGVRADKLPTTFMDWLPPKRITKPFDVFWPLTFAFESLDQGTNVATWKATTPDGVMHISVSLAGPRIAGEAFEVAGTSGREVDLIDGIQYGTIHGVTLLLSARLVHRSLAGNGGLTLQSFDYTYTYPQVNDLLPESLFEP